MVLFLLVLFYGNAGNLQYAYDTGKEACEQLVTSSAMAEQFNHKRGYELYQLNLKKGTIQRMKCVPPYEEGIRAIPYDEPLGPRP